jgi:ubiquinone/menaquinone biosynthesis C-methylase UbiE
MIGAGTCLIFDENSFDLITSFYSLFHLEIEKQNQAFNHFFRMLRPEGLAYFTLASEEYTGSPEFCGTQRFAGVELPYSHVQPEAYRGLLEEVGFRVEGMDHRSVGGETMLWVLVRKPR